MKVVFNVQYFFCFNIYRAITTIIAGQDKETHTTHITHMTHTTQEPGQMGERKSPHQK
jgi:hypothetical protein